MDEYSTEEKQKASTSKPDQEKIILDPVSKSCEIDEEFLDTSILYLC